MSLDAALFSLHFVRRSQKPWIVDIYPYSASTSLAAVPPPVPKKDANSSSSKPVPFSGTIPDVSAQRARALEALDYSHQTPAYTRVRATNSLSYSTILLDGLIPDCLLASIMEPSSTTKKRTLRLHNPDSEVELEKKSMTFQQSWRFTFAGEEFSWKKEGSRGKQSSYTCEVIRKPDPSVLGAQYRAPGAKGKPGILQLMDYNLDRLGLEDKKGLEVTLVMSLSTLLDQEYDEKLAADGEDNMYVCNSGLPTDVSMLGSSSAWQEAEHRWKTSQPTPPGAMAQERRQGSASSDVSPESIADLEPNEMLVSKWGTVDEYTRHAISLLRSDGQGQGMYMIVLRSDSAETTPKAVQIAAAIKAAYYRLPDDAKGTVYGRTSSQGVEEELYQYLQTLEPTISSPSPEPQQTPAPKKKIIKLDAPTTSSSSSPAAASSPDSGKKKPYTPPSKLKIILSKERIGELEPKKQDDPYPASHVASSPARLSVPERPALPTRPHSPGAVSHTNGRTPSTGSATSPGPSPAAHGSNDASTQHLSKGKAFLNKLGIR